MEKVKIDELIKKYNEGLADEAEVTLLESLLAQGRVELAQLHALQQLHKQFMQLEYPEPSPALDERFYDMLARHKTAAKGSFWKNVFSWSPVPVPVPRLAMAVVMLFIGVAAGVWIGSTTNGAAEVALLNDQLTELREMMMLSLLEKESATERLRAVSLSHEMEAVSDKVTDALIQTLQKDPNVNVRLSALEALKPYVYKDSVRIKLVQSISQQESPLLQIALAELMAAIQEQASVTELKKLLERERTPVEVKKKIEESIQVMI